MFAYQKQTLPPSGHSYAVACKLTPSCLRANHYSQHHLQSPVVQNLIVARNNFIQIYEVYLEHEEEQDRKHEEKKSNEEQPFLNINHSNRPFRLFQIAEHTLHGTITGIIPIKTLDSADDGLDRLVISFKDAKMSLLEWSQELYDLVPISLHTYEKLPQVSQGDLTGYRSMLRNDPNNRCCALLLPQNCFAILPIVQEQNDLEGRMDANEFVSAPSFILEMYPISQDIRNILDFAFLPGYNEPTMAILYNKTPTWTGRLEIIQDTIQLVIITLDLASSHFPIIFKSASLPYDCFSLRPCPVELGGVIVLSLNSIIYLDQSSKIVVLPTNGWASEVTSLQNQTEAPLPTILDSHSFTTYASTSSPSPSSTSSPFTQQSTASKASLAMEGSFIAFVTSELAFISHRSGTIYALSFTKDGRSISSMKLTRMGYGPIPSVLEKLSDNVFFIGSIVGDGALVHVISNEPTSSTSPGYDDNVNNTDMNVDQSQSVAARSSIKNDDDDDLYQTSTLSPTKDPRMMRSKVNSSNIGSASAKAGTNAKSLSLRLDDELSAYGTIRDMTMGVVSDESPPELVAATGLEAGGGFTVFNRAIHPRHKKTLESYGQPVDSIWTLKIRSKDSSVLTEEVPHNIIAISRSKNTQFFEISSNSNSDPTVIFKDDGNETIGVYEIFDNSSILWATRSNIKILHKSETSEWNVSQELRLIEDDEVSVEKIHVSDPYVLVWRANGTLRLFQQDPSERRLKTVTVPTEFTNEGALNAACLYKDYHADLPIRLSSEESSEYQNKNTTKAETDAETEEALERESDTKAKDSSTLMEVDDEDDEIYGSLKSNQKASAQLSSNFHDAQNDVAPTVAPVNFDGSPTHWLFVLTANSMILIYSLPSFSINFMAHQVDILPRVLHDSRRSNLQTAFTKEKNDEDSAFDITQLVVSRIGSQSKADLYMTLLLEGSLVSYKIIVDYANVPEEEEEMNKSEENPSQHKNYLGITLIKSLVKNMASARRRKAADGTVLRPIPRSLMTFSDISNMCGIFLSGDSPAFLMRTEKGPLRKFELGIKDITSFAEIHERGVELSEFIYIASDGNVVQAGIPDAVLDSDLPWYKVGEGRTYNTISFDSTNCVYLATSLFEAPFGIFNDDGQLTWVPETNDIFVPQNFRSALELVVPGSWDTVDGYEFRQNEVVLCMKSVSLETKATMSGLREFVAVGTAICRGEDLAVRGAIYIFEVISVNAPPDKPQSCRALRMLFSEDVRGAVGALCEIDGYLAHSMGQKIYIKALEQDERLISVGFLDVGVHTTTIRSVKNYLLVGDSMRGVQLAAFQEEPYKVVLLGKETTFSRVDIVDFMIQEGQVGLISVDVNGIARIVDYNPENFVESENGRKLLRRTEFQLASTATCSLIFAKRTSPELPPRQNGILFGGSDGSLMYLMPVREAVYRRLQMLERQVARHVQPALGLNPRAFRTVRNDAYSKALSRGILDGDLLMHFFSPAIVRQETMAKRVSTDIATVEVNLRTLKAPW